MTTHEEDLLWGFGDEQHYTFLRHKYGDRRKLKDEYEEKRKAAEKVKDGDPLYHRIAVSAEMAQLRLDMAYIIDKNNNLEQYIEQIQYLHERVAILEGAYGHMKMMAETVRIDYSLISKLYEKLKPLLKEQEDGKAIRTGTTG